MTVSCEDGRSMGLEITVTGIINIWTSNHTQSWHREKIFHPLLQPPPGGASAGGTLSSQQHHTVTLGKRQQCVIQLNYTGTLFILFYFILEAKMQFHWLEFIAWIFKEYQIAREGLFQWNLSGSLKRSLEGWDGGQTTWHLEAWELGMGWIWTGVIPSR